MSNREIATVALKHESIRAYALIGRNLRHRHRHRAVVECRRLAIPDMNVAGAEWNDGQKKMPDRARAQPGMDSFRRKFEPIAYAAALFAPWLLLKYARTLSGSKSRKVPPDAKCCTKILPTAQVMPAPKIGTERTPRT